MKSFKLALIILCAVVLTALSIDAADTFKGSQSTLLGQLIGTQTLQCPKGMTHVPTALTYSCVDTYEASASDACPIQNPLSAIDTQTNLIAKGCASVSQAHVMPWRQITREQAQVACSKTGKRLPTAVEWHQLALGTIDNQQTCNLATGKLSQTGTHNECTSGAGVQDAIGNVWEWVADDVTAGEYNNRQLPKEGYVTQVTQDGIGIVTANQPDALHSGDYFWSSKASSTAMMRGGFYGSGEDGGLYAVHAGIDLTFFGEAVGFRCVQ